MLTRTTSSLPESVEKLVHGIIGCGLEVHRRLGPGYLESVYHKAMRMELAFQNYAFKSEHWITLTYRDKPLHKQRIDLIVEDAVVVEIKAVAAIDPMHTSQVVSYLRATNLRAGLVINFNSTLLKHGIRRIVL